jgi:hypothetical protein
MGPSLWQILIYFAFPTTPLYETVLAEGRYLPAYQDSPDYRTFDGFSMHFKHDHFSPEELEGLQKALYRECFETLGPSLVRIIMVWFVGYRNMKNFSRPLLRQRAERMRQYIRNALPGLYPAIRFGPNRERRAEARRLLKEIEKELGPLSIKERLQCWGTIPLSAWTWMTEKLNLFQQPRLLRIEHRFDLGQESILPQRVKDALESKGELLWIHHSGRVEHE